MTYFELNLLFKKLYINILCGLNIVIEFVFVSIFLY